MLLPAVVQAVHAAGLAEWGDVTFEVVLLATGSSLMLLLAAVARSIRRLRHPLCSILTILIGGGDFCTDLIFARTAWRRVSLLLATGCGNAAGACEPNSLVTARVAEAQLLANLSTIFVGAPIVICTVPLAVLVLRDRAYMDAQTFARYPSFFGCLLVLATSNVELLRLLPWHEQRFDGFPTLRLLALSFISSIMEDIPQVVLQIYVIAFTRPTDGEPAYALTVSYISLAFSLASIWWRGFRKLIVALFPSSPTLRGPSRPALRGPRTPKRSVRQHPFFGAVEAATMRRSESTLARVSSVSSPRHHAPTGEHAAVEMPLDGSVVPITHGELQRTAPIPTPACRVAITRPRCTSRARWATSR